MLGTDVIVKADAFLERAVCHDHVYVGPGTNLRGCVIGRNTDLRAHVRVEDGTVVGNECFVGQDAVINPNVKIYPFKTVESGAIVTSSIVWESRGARTLFGPRGVRGLANVDISPEVVARVAMAYGTALPKGSTISTSRDTSRLARALKRGLISGLNLSGVNVEDMELATVPLTGFRCATGRRRVASPSASPPAIPTPSRCASSTTTVATSTRRCSARSSGSSTGKTSGGRSVETSATSRSRHDHSSSIPRRSSRPSRSTVSDSRSFKIVLDYSFGAVSIVMPNLLTKLRAEVLAVNPFASTIASVADTGDTNVLRVADLVRASGSDLGFVIDPDGELSTVIDDTGRILEPEELLLAICSLLAEAVPDARVAVPVNVTSAVEEMLGDGLGRAHEIGEREPDGGRGHRA